LSVEGKKKFYKKGASKPPDGPRYFGTGMFPQEKTKEIAEEGGTEREKKPERGGKKRGGGTEDPDESPLARGRQTGHNRAEAKGRIRYGGEKGGGVKWPDA